MLQFIPMKEFFHQTFSSLKIRNYRVYYIGQIISVSGTFLQSLAQDWLVLKLTGSGTLLGAVLAFQFFPVLIFSSYGGVIADRFPKRKILYITQSIGGLLALFLGILILTNIVQLWMVFVFALGLGLVSSIDNPVRQSFVSEMVGRDQIKNAVSLWAVLISVCRVIGPAIAGVLIASVGLGLCFIINAISYIAVLIALFMINSDELHHTPLQPKAKGQISEGLRYVKNTPILLVSLVMMAIIGTISFEWQASLPLFASFVLHGDAGTYSALSVALGIGMLIGGLFNASSGSTSLRPIVYSALFLGISMIISSISTNIIFVLLIFVFIGLFLIIFANLSNSILQMNSEPHMRGRVMSLWSMAFFGSTAIGGPFIGWIGEMFGAQWSLAVGGIAALIAALYGFIVLERLNLHHRN